eukprot:m.13674 g.13674  ORF g.13674 m.13674 type:complete len:64 (-) comp10175_c0_seq1:146-337(-)
MTATNPIVPPYRWINVTKKILVVVVGKREHWELSDATFVLATLYTLKLSNTSKQHHHNRWKTW